MVVFIRWNGGPEGTWIFGSQVCFRMGDHPIGRGLFVASKSSTIAVFPRGERPFDVCFHLFFEVHDGVGCDGSRSHEHRVLPRSFRSTGTCTFRVSLPSYRAWLCTTTTLPCGQDEPWLSSSNLPPRICAFDPLRRTDVHALRVRGSFLTELMYTCSANPNAVPAVVADTPGIVVGARRLAGGPLVGGGGMANLRFPSVHRDLLPKDLDGRGFCHRHLFVGVPPGGRDGGSPEGRRVDSSDRTRSLIGVWGFLFPSASNGLGSILDRIHASTRKHDTNNSNPRTKDDVRPSGGAVDSNAEDASTKHGNHAACQSHVEEDRDGEQNKQRTSLSIQARLDGAIHHEERHVDRTQTMACQA